MYKHVIILLALFVVFYPELRAQEVIIEEPFPQININNPVGLENTGDGPMIYILSQSGQIYEFNTEASSAEPQLWLDVSGRLVSGGERGLLGLAFAPDYEESGRFYLQYTASGPLRSVISRFSLDDNGNADPDSEEVLLEFSQPFNNHNGGQLKFGQDGYLYIASGDGGSGGDPQGNAQNTGNLLGAMLRIDVNTDEGYEIPPDNPFFLGGNGEAEIFAWGLRNPWRFSFDRESGALWTGDVGQNAWEAIHIIENGKNYGWNIIEGSNCYPPGSTCDTDGLEMPIFEYDHSQGDQSITGGYIYRGERNSSLYGKYIYGDFISGRIWALDYNEEDETVHSNVELENTNFGISSFGEDSAGEIYILSYFNGRIYTFLASPAEPVVLQPEPEEIVEPEFTLSWDEVGGAEEYRYEIASDPEFQDIMFEGSTFSTSETLNWDGSDTDAWVRIEAENEAGVSGFSEVVPFRIEAPVSNEPIAGLPDRVTLHQNYPNPFNPTTTISFDLPESEFVRLEIYDLNGRKAGVAVNRQFTAGTHEVVFDASGLASGIYIYQLTAGEINLTRQMMLVK